MNSYRIIIDFLYKIESKKFPPKKHFHFIQKSQPHVKLLRQNLLTLKQMNWLSVLPLLNKTSQTAKRYETVNKLGSFACLETAIYLQRDLSSYINDIYIPSSFVVSLSFISFFIDYKSAAARAPLGATSVLTITTMTGGKNRRRHRCFLRHDTLIFYLTKKMLFLFSFLYFYSGRFYWRACGRSKMNPNVVPSGPPVQN